MKKTTIVLLLAVFFAAFPSFAAVDFELSVNANAMGNALEDSSETIDYTAVFRAAANYYPLAQAQFRAAVDYTDYSDFDGLSNLKSNLGFTWIPTSQESKTRFFVSGNFSGAVFKDEFRNFSSKNDFDIIASASRMISSSSQVRLGLKQVYNVYTNSPVDDRTTTEFFVGYYRNLAEHLSLDVEAGIATGNYQYYDRAVDSGAVFTDPEDSQRPFYWTKMLNDGDNTFYYVSPRISGQINSKTGFSITYQYRTMDEQDGDPVIFGYSTGLLSPWTDIYDGHAIIASVKTYMLPRMIVTLGGGYWERNHLQTLDYIGGPFLSTVGGENNRGGIVDREDERSRIYLEIIRPFSLWDIQLEPKLRVEHVTNISNAPVYDYSHETASFGIKASF